MAKYIIETNLVDDVFGRFVPGKECRNVGIDEMKGYYYWPGDVFSVFMMICNHVIPGAICYSGDDDRICAMMQTKYDDYYLRFKRISDVEAKASGRKEFNHMKWIEQLREDLKRYNNSRN